MGYAEQSTDGEKIGKRLSSDLKSSLYLHLSLWNSEFDRLPSNFYIILTHL